MTRSRQVGQYERRSPAEWAGIVEDYQQSGQSRDGFSAERGISVASLGYHLVKQRKQLQRPARLLAVELVSSSVSESTLRVELANGRRIAVQAGFDAELLRQVVVVLER
jgi:hypothetical protein